jgi:ArsR family transcriptional regulator, arsenate/arsenite/antimonite-responsive transcriptional repressor
MPETRPPRHFSPQLARSLRDTALSLNIASNTTRLQILLSLSKGPRTTSDLCRELGKDGRFLGQHLHTLMHGNLVASQREGRYKAYRLTDDGLAMLKAAGLISGQSVGEAPRGEQTIPPATATAPMAPGGIDGLSRLLALLKAFADPVRLRLLCLLSSADEVCVCHLHGALDLPQSTVSRHLSALRTAGLIAGRREGTWVYYRLAHPVDELQGGLIGLLAPGRAKSDVFEEDRGRLARLAPCPDQPNPTGVMPHFPR